MSAGRTLRDVADATVGFVGKMTPHYRSEGVTFLRSQDVRPHRIELESALKIDPEFEATIQKSRLRAGDVVVVRTGKPGVSAVVPPELQGANCSDLVVIRPGVAMNSRWLSYYINAVAQGFVKERLVGAVQQHFNVKSALEMPIPQLSRRSQEAQAEVLGAFDDKIEANRAVASAAQTLAVASVKSIASSMKLGGLVRIVRKSTDPSLLNASAVTLFSLPAFDAGAAAVDSPSSIKSAKNLIQEPVVLVSKLNPRIPRIWAVDRLPVGLALASTEFVALAPHEVGIGALWAALLDPRFTRSLLERTAGTTGSHQRVKPEQMLDVDVPDVRELATEKRDLVESLCRKVNYVADENLRLAAARDELLPLLMSGKITVRDAEKTVEEVV